MLERKKISSLVNIVRDKVSSSSNNSTPYVGLESMGSNWSGLLGASSLTDSASENFAFQSGDILFGRLRPNLRKCERVSFSGKCSTDILVLRASEGMDARFCAHVMRSEKVARWAVSVSEGTRMPRASWSDVKEFAVFCPPVSAQSRIAEVLDVLDDQIRAHEVLIAKKKAILSGVMDDLFSARDSWVWGDLGSFLAVAPKNGFSPSEVGDWTGVRVVGLGCLTPDGFSPKQLKNIPSIYAGLSSVLLEDGDLLMSRANTRDLVGLVGCYEDVGGICIYPDLMMRLRVNGKVNRRFLELSLRNPYLRRQIMAQAVGTSESMVKISSAIVRGLLVAVPPLEEQRRIVSIIGAHDERIAAEKARLEKLRKLKAGLMDDLLTGRVRVDQLDELPV